MTTTDKAREEHVKTGFECNICFDLPTEPVVSLCGHVYCWPCMYRWIKRQGTASTCPVCKAGIGTDKLISLYTTGKDACNSKGTNVDGQLTGRILVDEDDGEQIPERPSQQRPVPTPQTQSFWRNTIERNGQGLQLAFVSFFPFFSFALQYGNEQGGIHRHGQADPLLLQRERLQIYTSLGMVAIGMLVVLWIILFG